jgi:DNA-binding response OmpR family regulator
MNKTVLVVDDDKDIVKLITKSLKFEQFEVISAYSGKEALSMLKENYIDFVVLDIMMPEMDGLEVCRNIRNDYNIPVTVHIKNIRKKLGNQCDFIKTIWDIGYKYIEGKE